MDNFGVVEVASQRRAVAPGWAYVPDNSSNSLSAGLAAAMAAAAAAEGAQAGGGAAGAAKNPRKRAARQAAGARSSLALFSDLTSRQETKLRRELELLDRDGGAVAGGGGGREAAIPIPAKAVKGELAFAVGANTRWRPGLTVRSPEQVHAERPQDPRIAKDVCQPPRRLQRVQRTSRLDTWPRTQPRPCRYNFQPPRCKKYGGVISSCLCRCSHPNHERRRRQQSPADQERRQAEGRLTAVHLRRGNTTSTRRYTDAGCTLRRTSCPRRRQQWQQQQAAHRPLLLHPPPVHRATAAATPPRQRPAAG